LGWCLMKTIISQLLNKNSPEILNDELFQLREQQQFHLLCIACDLLLLVFGPATIIISV
jgi:hypothetical protein